MACAGRRRACIVRDITAPDVQFALQPRLNGGTRWRMEGRGGRMAWCRGACERLTAGFEYWGGGGGGGRVYWSLAFLRQGFPLICLGNWEYLKKPMGRQLCLGEGER